MANKFEIRIRHKKCRTKSEILIKSRKILWNLFFNLNSNFSLLTSFFTLSIFYFLLPPSYLYSQIIWGPDVRLTYLNEATVYSPRIAVSGDTLHIVWYQVFIVDTIIVTEVMYKRSSDRGETWTQDTILSPLAPGGSYRPVIAVSGSVVYVVWNEDVGDSILYTRSTNSGREWNIPKTLSSSGFVVDIEVSGDSVFVYWGTTTAAYLSISTNCGFSWLPAQQVPKNQGGFTDDIAVHLPFIHLVYGGTTYPADIYYKRSTDIGQTWCDSIMLSENDIWIGQYPSIAVDRDSNIYVDWWDYKNSPYAWTGSIFFRRSLDDNSASWDTIQNITTLYRAKLSHIAVFENDVHIVWMDQRDYSGSPFDSFEIYYRYSSDRGNSWGPETRLTNDPNNSQDASLAVNSTGVYLVWADNRDLDSAGRGYEVYFKRGEYESGGIISKDSKETSPQFFHIYPNPSYSAVRCDSRVLDDERCIVEVFDIQGRKVWSCIYDKAPVEVVWDGRDKEGKEVRSGVYFIRLRTGKNNYQQKVVLLKGGKP